MSLPPNIHISDYIPMCAVMIKHLKKKKNMDDYINQPTKF